MNKQKRKVTFTSDKTEENKEMAKAKFDVCEQTDICAVLDVNEDNELVIIVDENAYNLDKILRANLGSVITMKLTKDTAE